MTREPILVPCEGSGQVSDEGVCRTCGRWWWARRIVPDHDRLTMTAWTSSRRSTEGTSDED